MVGHVQEMEIGARGFEHAGQIGAPGAPTGFDAISESVDRQAEGHTVDAAVKWFNATKGYGFVELSDGRGDAFLHLKALREAGLIRSERKGVELHNTSRCQEISTRFGPLLSAVLQAHLAQDQRRGGAHKARRIKRT